MSDFGGILVVVVLLMEKGDGWEKAGVRRYGDGSEHLYKEKF